MTILEIDGTRFRTLATDGDVFLGGHDFDERLVNYLAERFLEIHGVDPRSDPQDAAQLWSDAQEAKHTLSERSKATAVLFHAGIRMRVEVTCQQFEDLTRDLLERTETTTSLVVKQAGLNWRQIDRVLLVGGSGRMPMVGRMLRTVTGKEPDCSLSPDEVVAHGAALYANMLAGRAVAGQAACQLVNVNSHSLGVVAVHPRTKLKTNVVLIPKNTALPCRAVRTFQTARADQRSVKVSIVEGESERPEACIALGDCVVRDLPAGLPKSTPVEVEYAYHANGRIAVGARVPSVRYSQRIELQRDTARNLGDLEQWRARLCGRPEPIPAGKGDRDLLCEAPEGPFRQKVPVPFSPEPALLERLDTLYRAVGRTAVNLPLPDAAAAKPADCGCGGRRLVAGPGQSQKGCRRAAGFLGLQGGDLSRCPAGPGEIGSATGASASRFCLPGARSGLRALRLRAARIPAAHRRNPPPAAMMLYAWARQERLARRVILSAAKNLGGSAGAG